MAFIYETMKIEDYDEIYALWRKIPGIGLSSADERENIASYLQHNPGQSFVCRDNTTIVGTILCGNDGRRGFIHHTAVLPDYRHQGIATTLVQRALAQQRALDMKKVHLFIYCTNDLGKAFWQQQGFMQREDINIMSAEI